MHVAVARHMPVSGYGIRLRERGVMAPMLGFGGCCGDDGGGGEGDGERNLALAALEALKSHLTVDLKRSHSIGRLQMPGQTAASVQRLSEVHRCQIKVGGARLCMAATSWRGRGSAVVAVTGTVATSSAR